MSRSLKSIEALANLCAEIQWAERNPTMRPTRSDWAVLFIDLQRQPTHEERVAFAVAFRDAMRALRGS